MAIEIQVPALGESVTEATVGKWLKSVGDTVAVDEPICELETDKVALEVNATAAGTLSEIVAEEGANVEVGALLAKITEGEGAAAPAAAPAAEKAEAAPTGGGSLVEVHVPALGESVTEATVGKWLKAEGEAVTQDEPICELETDKVALEVNAPVSGALARIAAPEGATVELGALLATIDGTAQGTAAPKAAAPAAAAPAPAATAPAAAAPAGANVRASAAEVAKEKGIDVSKVKGSGAGGVVTKADVLAYASGGQAAAVAPAPVAAAVAAPAEEGGLPREEVVPMTRLRRTIAKRLKDAQNTAAMLTTYNEVDMSAVIALRNQYKEIFEKKHGSRLGFMSFFVKACVQALKEVPEVNAEIREDAVIYKNYYDIGVAASTPAGLVVPVVRGCENRSFSEIENEIARLGKRARDGKLSMDEMTGGTFTISNGGIFGSLMSSPILNAPQSGILGMHAIKERAVVENGQIVVRPMMYLALSYDHRIVDGKGAVTFLVRVKENLEDPQRLILDL
ncbi:2-oxoglutarate dehydrogenase complex dihydrolipoyllysine-residue succinyltransferase [Emcibacter nanhaiensis]|uniref:Dihydrolipoyllysine-residue succinyltransferase component of 2-oxoglutarate dehydrogenase complex n=1 Tax=Emcibacter nanhaiensis TaxID=1505037 RepID=A0A501PMU0_9PROT|nr:2-oxoglutarate dehydrogenase complex dihydrolipoyllysine-residue succinyltransferase [Emcibacter nanhaiensis]TPD61615.1 2-oxoglutarate dehydrogenase complex dihydrolipoyllysine-residue succinyltransferase [Emcibacter nanhaiensis]